MEDNIQTEKPLTLFAWGYWGWGNATQEFVALADAVEEHRGFAPPLFVDVRKFRSVRAKGFNGNNFANRIGKDRYTWIKGLGNDTPEGPGVRIIAPERVMDLLDIAQNANLLNRRVLFFCSCAHPRQQGHPLACHRVTVADLVSEAAVRRGQSINVVEWPHQQHAELEVEVESALFQKLRKGRKSIPLAGEKLPVEYCVPWGSIAVVRCQEESFPVLIGPVQFSAGWQIPLAAPLNTSATLETCRQEARQWRTEYGYQTKPIP